MVKRKRKSEREGFYFAISLLFYIFLSNQSSINLSYHALSPSFPNPTKHILPFSTQLIPTNPILSQNIPTYPVSTHIYPPAFKSYLNLFPSYPNISRPNPSNPDQTFPYPIQTYSHLIPTSCPDLSYLNLFSQPLSIISQPNPAYPIPTFQSLHPIL